MKMTEEERGLLSEWYSQAQEAFSDAYFWDYWDETLEEKFGFRTEEEREEAGEILGAAMAKLEQFLSTGRG